MAGRIITFQTHPYECPTNYAALLAMRCNIDVQDLRRVPPPRFWMQSEELEPHVDATDVARHGPYPQRFAESSLGPRPDWGWMGLLSTTSDGRVLRFSTIDWLSIFQRLSSAPCHSCLLYTSDAADE